MGTLTGLAGDYNGSGAVDAADYVMWCKGLNTKFTQYDYDVWRANFVEPPAAAQVPMRVPPCLSGHLYCR